MPKMATIRLNPDFKATNDAQKAAVAAHGKNWSLSVPYITAVENVRTSGGMYQMVAARKPVAEEADVDPDDVPTE